VSDTSVSSTLAMRAKRLAALARAKSEDERESQDQGQAETALRKLNTELASLRSVLVTHRKLRAVGVPVSEVEDLDKPATRLREQISAVGRPTAQYLTARVRDVANAHSAIAEGDRQAWRAWAERTVEGLPHAVVPRLSFVRRSDVAKRIADMRRWAGASPTHGDVTSFVVSLDRVRDELDHVEDASIDAVLARFINGRIRLADLSDDELEMVRAEESLSEQLYLQLS